MVSRRAPLRIIFALFFVLAIVAGYFVLRAATTPSQAASTSRYDYLRTWFDDPAAHADWTIRAGKTCRSAPFVFPTNGYIGFIWGDSFRPGHHHQGLDIFGGEAAGVTPVVAAYSGYLSRLPDWKSSVIIRLPEDPLQPGRQIWTYYTHMADADGRSYIFPEFPPGTSEVYVAAGTLLGYQGNYSGDPDNPTGVHLHFSIVLDDGQGSFRNELEMRNTLDPSPYFQLPLNAELNQDEIPVCQE
jgi:murein DD-endopeptidase MepM/ murein hydrolase activator NlpD